MIQAANGLVPILRMWKSGVLIMDEVCIASESSTRLKQLLCQVDVLLHPLRSELNFPIGARKQIDMHGTRWELPIMLLDVIVSQHRRAVQERGDAVVNTGGNETLCTAAFDFTDEAWVAEGISDTLNQIRDTLREGSKNHKTQSIPHLVLLDHQWYKDTLQPKVAQWLCIWLHVASQGRVKSLCCDEEIMSYLQGNTPAVFDNLDSHSPCADSFKMLNLAKEWCISVLPHVLSKINRVTYGLLESVAAGRKAAGNANRGLCAVPFIGKDVPSSSSEFAHPDVLIGLTVLAYRYEGLRIEDVKRIVTQLKHDFVRQVGNKDKRDAHQVREVEDCWLTLQWWWCSRAAFGPFPASRPEPDQTVEDDLA